MYILYAQFAVINSNGDEDTLWLTPTLQASLSSTLPPNSAITGYATEGALFISVHPSTKIVLKAPSNFFSLRKCMRVLHSYAWTFVYIMC